MDKAIKVATSRFQIGGVAGHRPQEHIFSIKSVIGKYIMEKKLICYDISGFFDKEVLSDAVDELYSIDLDTKVCILFFKLNEVTRVRVRTRCSYSNWGEVGDILGQGSGGAAKVKMTEVMRLMQTTLNKDKSGYIFMGFKRQVEEAREKVKDSPVFCGDFTMKVLMEEKWLGDYLAGGLKESVKITVQRRESKTRRASYEIVNIVKDYRAQLIGGFKTGLVLWESCVVPSLLYNCSTWVEVGKEEEKHLNDQQDYFLRLLWWAGPGTPRVALRADTATRSMSARIWKEKILLVYHISHLEVGDLARDLMNEQVRQGWPGLVVEVSKLCETLRLEDTSSTYKNIVDYAREGKKAKKMKIMYNDTLEMKDYVNYGDLYTARTTWEIRSHMLRVAGNFTATGWRCQACQLEVGEDQEHLAFCDGYTDFRASKDLTEEDAGQLCQERDG